MNIKNCVHPILLSLERVCYVILLIAYTYGIWQLANRFQPVEQQIEINDLNKRLENCHWQLLERNAEIETLSKKLKQR